jgi:hypothetical protein
LALILNVTTGNSARVGVPVGTGVEVAVVAGRVAVGDEGISVEVGTGMDVAEGLTIADGVDVS